jgi:hypothetical protein
VSDSGQAVPAAGHDDGARGAIGKSATDLVETASVGAGEITVSLEQPGAKGDLVPAAEPAQPFQDEGAVEWSRGRNDSNAVAGTKRSRDNHDENAG